MSLFSLGPSKQTKGKRGKKPSKPIRQNETLGVSFLDDSEDESLEAPTLNQGGSKEESLEVGRRTPSNKGARRTSQGIVRTSNLRKRSKLTGVNIGCDDTERTSSSAALFDPSPNVDREKTRSKVSNRNLTIEMNSDQLLQEIGKASAEEEDNNAIAEFEKFSRTSDKDIYPECSTSRGRKCSQTSAKGVNPECSNTKDIANTSVLDDIFGTSPLKRPVRKPPPGKGRVKKRMDTGYGSEDLFSDSSTTAPSSQDESVAEKITNESTLKDDLFDCFSDPAKRKQQKRKANTIVHKLLSESEDEYKRLFETGKMKKKEKPVVILPIEQDENPPEDQTPSLF